MPLIRPPFTGGLPGIVFFCATQFRRHVNLDQVNYCSVRLAFADFRQGAAAMPVVVTFHRSFEGLRNKIFKKTFNLQPARVRRVRRRIAAVGVEVRAAL